MSLPKNLQEEIHQLHAHICSGLADPSRIMILYLIAEKDCTVSEIVEALGMNQSTVSRHLKVLREVGLVTSERDGQHIHYRLKDPRVIHALNLLREILADTMKERAQLLNIALPLVTLPQGETER